MYTIKSKVEVIDNSTNQVVTTYNDQKQLLPTDDGIDLNFEVVNSIGGPVVRPPKPPKF
jgi:plastocyanin domain-containing protein